MGGNWSTLNRNGHGETFLEEVNQLIFSIDGFA
jgi:hypothetical protein